MSSRGGRAERSAKKSHTLTMRRPVRRRMTASAASHRGLRILFMGILMLGMGQSLFFAILPPIARDIGLSESQTGIIFSLSAGLWVFCSPFWGRKSDLWGRRRVMVIGLSGFAASTILIAVAIFARQEGWLPALLVLPVLIAARAIFGIFGSGTMPAAHAYMAERSHRAKRANAAAAITASFGIGNIVGPGFAAGLVVLGFLTPFFFVGALGFFAAIMILILLPERRRSHFHKDRSDRLGLFSPSVRPFMMMGILASYAQAALIQLSAFYFIDQLNLDLQNATQMVGIALMVMAMAALFAQFGLIQRFEMTVQTILFYGALTMVVAFLGLALSASYGLLVFFLGLAGLGFGLLRPGIMAAASLSVGRKYQGSVAGVINATAAVGHMINPFTGAVLYQYYPSSPFLLSAACMAGCLLITLYHPKIRALRLTEFDQDESAIPAPLAVHTHSATPHSALTLIKKRVIKRRTKKRAKKKN